MVDQVKTSMSKPMTSNVALLWDESFLWGIMAYKALNSANLPFDLIRSQDIKNGKLKKYKMLFAPGGWASNKLKSLGEEGVNEIKKFVKSGGNYLGFCGGAGLATLDGIGLLNIKRKPTKERVPSFSGRIELKVSKHPVWEGIPAADAVAIRESPLLHPTPYTLHPVFHAWWPSQFYIEDRSIKILASYGDALPDAFSSDLNVGDVATNGDWEELEKVYRINLDPKRLLNEPAVVEGNYGKGKVILSLVHFDTPDDVSGQLVLKNLWKHLKSQELGVKSQELRVKSYNSKLIAELEAAITDLVSLGERNFLWFWKNPMLLQWRRGVRGLEYCTLYVMVKEIAAQSTEHRTQNIDQKLGEIRDLLASFADRAKRLLLLERQAMQKGRITYEKCDDPEIRKLRLELFSASKSHGGMFKELIDEIDGLLFELLNP
ncbi:MAG: hypothetical protein C4560_06195 [Nitrospiraceae bacterium]|nr:MAG: hypothetical protein C4560_06195 [Nitrospiraceae bacterium]